MEINYDSDPNDNARRFTPAELPRLFSSLVKVDVYALSHPGHVRNENGDHHLVIRGGRALETVFTSLTENQPGDLFDETAYCMVVADGVGGENAGEIASGQAIYTLLSLFLHTPDWQFRWRAFQKNTVMWRMVDRFRRVNAALLQQATADPDLAGMCTTMTAAITYGDSLIVTHIGDSRAYRLRGGNLERLTRDHTVAQHLMEDGMDVPRDPLLPELRNVLMQSLGSQESACAPEVHDYSLEDKDQLLLCTDGLTDMVDERLIEAVLNRETSARAACRSLIDLALSKGGRDNVTVVVARYSIPPPVS